MTSYRDRVVLITGAASGIGRQMARVLAAEGARIGALDLQEAALAGLADELKGRTVATAVANVTDVAAVRAAVRRLEEQLGPTDVLIASAGIGRSTPALAFHAEDVAAQVEVNLIGVINSIDAVIGGMRRRRQGHLVVLSSLASYCGLPLMAGYSASKAGVNALCDSLRVELRGAGIAVTTLCPGWVRTPLTDPLGLRPSELMDVERAVQIMLAGMRARRPFVAFPARLVWQVRLLRYLPQPLRDWLAHRFLVRAMRR
jgi:NAD(P)-dependent dehydrogenase (short-subunit alcohol dehydrogenase family)